MLKNDLEEGLAVLNDKRKTRDRRKCHSDSDRALAGGASAICGNAASAGVVGLGEDKK